MLRDAGRRAVAGGHRRAAARRAVDHAICSARWSSAQLFELTEVREHEWNPLQHNPGALLHALIARPFAPVGASGCESLAGRLRPIPDALATARAVLRDCPRIHLETAVDQFAGAAALVRDEVPRLLPQAPALRGTVAAGRGGRDRRAGRVRRLAAVAGGARRGPRPAPRPPAVGGAGSGTRSTPS